MTQFIHERHARVSLNRPMAVTVAAVILVGAFLFYWYEIRPIRVYRLCTVQASANARALLKSKAEIAKGTKEGGQYESLIRKNMYLRSDYASFLQKCLLYYGRPVTATQPEQK